MGLSYNPQDAGSGGPTEGDYPYKVVSATEKTFKSGNQGLEITIEFVAGDRILTTWCRFPYAKRLKKLREMCDGLGVRFDPPPDIKDFLEKSGTAFFIKDDRGYLVPDVFHPKKGQAEAAFTSTPAEDDVPF